jgi:hypothetical protein
MRTLIVALLLACVASSAQAQFGIEINPFGGGRDRDYGYDRRGYDYDRGRYERRDYRYDRRYERRRCAVYANGICVR